MLNIVGVQEVAKKTRRLRFVAEHNCRNLSLHIPLQQH